MLDGSNEVSSSAARRRAQEGARRRFGGPSRGLGEIAGFDAPCADDASRRRTSLIGRSRNHRVAV